jgi:hypothetical protein
MGGTALSLTVRRVVDYDIATGIIGTLLPVSGRMPCTA